MFFFQIFIMHGEKKILNVISKLEVILKNEYPAIRSIFKNLVIKFSN